MILSDFRVFACLCRQTALNLRLVKSAYPTKPWRSWAQAGGIALSIYCSKIGRETTIGSERFLFLKRSYSRWMNVDFLV
jgi:hypothetical protein